MLKKLLLTIRMSNIGALTAFQEKAAALAARVPVAAVIYKADKAVFKQMVATKAVLSRS